MLFCVWTLPELGSFGNYLLFIWNALKIHCVSRLICMEDLWHVNTWGIPMCQLIDMHGKCMACTHVPGNISSVLCYSRIWLKCNKIDQYIIINMSTYIIVMCFIGFLDLTNVGKNIKIKAIGVLRAELLTKTYFVVAILKFQFLSGNRWNDVVVPAIFEFSILKNTLSQIVTLLSGSAHVKRKMLHIRSTTMPPIVNVLVHIRMIEINTITITMYANYQ